MPDTLKPLPCPCGGKVRCVSKPYTHDKFMVMCFNEGCGNSQDKWYDTKEEAIDAWNRRVGHEPAGECAEHNRAERGSWCGEEGEKG